MLSLLQAYRGLAALLVVLFHASGTVNGYWSDPRYLRIFGFGHAGVQFFFVLSGFIIYYVHRKDIGQPDRLVAYLGKRVVRIYPAYLCVTVLLAPFWLLIPAFGEPYHKSMMALILSLLLIPQAHDPHLNVAWTLIHEMMFYLLFATLLLSRRAGRIALVCWFVTIVAVNVALEAKLSFPASYVLSVNNLLFAAGMLAAWLVIHRPQWLPHGPGVFLLGNLLFLLTGAAWNSRGNETGDLQHAGFVVLFGFASFLIVINSANSRLESFFGRRKILRLLGDASYSIYLAHFPALALAARLLRHSGAGPLPSILLFMVIFSFATLAGLALYRFVEKPLVSFCRNRLAAPAGRISLAAS